MLYYYDNVNLYFTTTFMYNVNYKDYFCLQFYIFKMFILFLNNLFFLVCKESNL